MFALRVERPLGSSGLSHSSHQGSIYALCHSPVPLPLVHGSSVSPGAPRAEQSSLPWAGAAFVTPIDSLCVNKNTILPLERATVISQIPNVVAEALGLAVLKKGGHSENAPPVRFSQELKSPTSFPSGAFPP